MNPHQPRMTPAAIAAAAKGDFQNAMVAATPGGIEAQEKAGQTALNLKFTRLPKDGMDRYRPILERLGFTIGEDFDRFFVNVTAPAGWTTRPTDHSMHSYILDDQGRQRGSIFYKAAFYDERADFSLQTRYQGGGDYRGKDRYSAAKDTATGAVLHELGPITDYSDQMKADQATFDYLDKTFPNWKSVEAYW